MSDTLRAPRTARVVVIGVVWLFGAIAIGASGRLGALKPPAPQIVLLALTALLILAGARVQWLREWGQAIDVRVLVGIHLTRFVGAYFLVLQQRGELPSAFARPAGWGDLLVAVLAVALLAAGAPTTHFRRRAYRWWNALGAVDILFVVATAARLAMGAPSSMRALQELPLALLPTFLVPVIIASHVLLFVRLRGDAPASVLAPAV